MGKASRWIRNLLLGKKEDKINSKDGDGGVAAIVPSSSQFTTAILPATPRRRWSFRRSNTTQKVVVNHKSCRSFDSIITSQLLSQALFDYAVQHQNHTTMLVVPPAAKTVDRVPSEVTVAAAMKIQAAFRSYLARKALCALRGLVKLQALVRGHLVRKRTAAMVRCMRALVAIQVRARFQRIQMVEGVESRSNLGATGKQGFVMAHERRLSASQLDYNEKLGQFASKTDRQSSRRFLIDSSPFTCEKSMRLHIKPIDEVSTASQTSTKHDEPNYMTRTESSRAKARSQSEPRQRPTKQKRENRLTSSKEGLRALPQNHEKDHDSLLTTLHGSSRSIKNFEFDSASTCTNSSSYYTTHYAYETAESLR